MSLNPSESGNIIFKCIIEQIKNGKNYVSEYSYKIIIKKMDTHKDSSSEIYEVEKIINCKYYRNKKYYLVKWLCYPIYESTWEPKSNLKSLNYMIDAFEAEYPYSVDQFMYDIYKEELEKRSNKRNKRKKISKEFNTSSKFLSKKKKMEFFSKSELKDEFFDKLKVHLHLNIIQRHSKAQESDLIIDLGSSTTESEENALIGEPDKENLKVTEEKNYLHQLIMPIME